MKVSAVIFDLNGTILDDEEVYNRAFNTVLKSLGVDTTIPIPHERGVGVKENWVKYIEKFQIKTPKSPEILAIETQKAYLHDIPQISVRTGFEDFIEGIKDGGVKIGLATSNTWEVTDHILDKLNLSDLFDSITTSEEVKFNKPDPDLFIMEADKLGAELYECLVIEDAFSGIEAAHRAGMKVIAISPDEKSLKDLEKADLIVEGFSEITPAVIDQL